MTYTFTHDELHHPKHNISDLVVLAVIKRHADKNGKLKNKVLLKNLPLSEKTMFRCINVLIDTGYLENKKGIKLVK